MRTLSRLIAAVFAAATVATLATASPEPMPLDTGSCYSVKPICFAPQRAVCLCDYSMNCFWACR